MGKLSNLLIDVELLRQQMYFLLLHSLMFNVDHLPETAAYLEPYKGS